MRLIRHMPIVLLIIAIAPEISSGFDGSRQDFFLATGIGPGVFSADYYWGREEDGSTISTDFKIGAGATNRFLIYWGSHANWALDSQSNSLGNAGIGLRYYLSDQAPSIFVSGVLGYEGYSGYGGDHTGPGWSASFGYEFLKNWVLFSYICSGTRLERHVQC